MLTLPYTGADSEWPEQDTGHTTRVLIGNDFSEDVRDDRGWTGWWVQRIAWFARPGDILVLPVHPEEAFLEYVTSLTRVPRESLRVVVPPAHDGSQGTLSPSRLADPEFVEALEEAVGGREVTHFSALWPDVAVARLARALGVQSAMPGHGFVDQAGGVMVNSKSAFRTIAGGIGLPVPEGAVCTGPEVAEQAITELLPGGPVVVKHDFLSGGRGNEVLTSGESFRAIGARRVVRVSGRADVRSYVRERWAWLTAGGKGRPIVERYARDSSAFFAEFLLGDDGVELLGDGELLSAPYAVGQIMPSQGLEPNVMEKIVAGGRRLAHALRAIGYRGVLSPDAIVTPDREVLFTEYNGRVTGSTHIYGRIGHRVVGGSFGKDRVILERVWPEGWTTPSFTAAHRALTDAGVAYDPATRTGVVLTNAFDGSGGVMYCVVAGSLAAAWDRDRALKPLFSRKAGASRGTSR
ncbi:peptide ligase PGM1-related protein [Streptomyces sp. NPDC001852]|uniref:preATP grasp domain-containing protein n=1 Tax=Streptomyces sp. NPDC001852 TaxID=3364619 RepID=UPI00369BF2E9